MRILIVGGGGREHALAWRIRKERPDTVIIAAPGNPGIAELAECVPVAADDVDALLLLARQRSVDLTVVGPEAPLAAGIVDRFQAGGQLIFGPSARAARIETSKAFAKQLMVSAGIPTARASIFGTAGLAKEMVRELGAPVVIKASGLAGGKGVVVCDTVEEADRAIDGMLSGGRFGEAGHAILVEEFMRGEELSVFAITNGTDFVLLPGLQDHKRLLDSDQGPNTGGMGAYVPVTLAVTEESLRSIFSQTLAALRGDGSPFKGLLYCGLIITEAGPKVVEFNCRFGDPETQALMPALGDEVSVLDLLLASARGAPLPAISASASSACVTTVVAARGYPDSPVLGDVVTLPAAPANDVIIFHAGTRRDDTGLLRSAGGRVLSVSAIAPTVSEAGVKSLAGARGVGLSGGQLRSDIGWREIARAPGN